MTYIRTALCLCLIAFAGNTSAQLPDYSIAPDWVLTDIDGQEHQLYDYLDQGITVFIDFSATWCDPCWIYQNRNHLDQLYSNYGPNGTQEVMVFMIEGDPTTSFEDLQGTGSNTLGNWIANTSYPIIDDPSITELYQVGYWPTVYKICPSKRIELIGAQPASVLYACLDRCQGPIGTNNGAIFSYNAEQGYFCDHITAHPEVTIQNEGSAVMESCIVDFYNNGQLIQSKQWTGSVAPQTTTQVTFDPLLITDDASFSFNLHSPNGHQDEASEYNTLDEISLKAPISGPTAVLHLHTDFWPEEISWVLKDAEGEVLYDSNQFPPLSVNTAYEYHFDLGFEGCYQLDFFDAFGDGLINGAVGPNQYALGAVSLESEGAVLWNDIDYGFGIEVPFEMSRMVTSASEVEDKVAISLFPNPATKQVQLDLSLDKQAQLNIQLFDLLGRSLLQVPSETYAAGQHQLPIDVSSLTDGIYLVQLYNETENSSYTERLLIQK